MLVVANPNSLYLQVTALQYIYRYLKLAEDIHIGAAEDVSPDKWRVHWEIIDDLMFIDEGDIVSYLCNHV